MALGKLKSLRICQKQLLLSKALSTGHLVLNLKRKFIQHLKDRDLNINVRQSKNCITRKEVRHHLITLMIILARLKALRRRLTTYILTKNWLQGIWINWWHCQQILIWLLISSKKGLTTNLGNTNLNCKVKIRSQKAMLCHFTF